VATAAGVLLVLSPSLAGLGLALFALVILLTRIVSLASILTCAALPLLAAGPLHPRGTPSVLVVTAICALIIARHATNIHRLLQGTEPRIGSGPRRGDGPTGRDE
jgi:glycerol-3-phosphate acyltransferase PlsY